MLTLLDHLRNGLRRLLLISPIRHLRLTLGGLMNLSKASSAEKAKERLHHVTRSTSATELDSLLSRIRKEDKQTRLHLVKALERNGNDQALQALAMMLPERDSDVHRAIASILLRPQPRYAAALYHLLTCADAPHQRAALDLIAADLHPRHVPAVSGYLSTALSNGVIPPDSLGERAVKLLEMIGTREAWIAVAEWRRQHPPPPEIDHAVEGTAPVVEPPLTSEDTMLMSVYGQAAAALVEPPPAAALDDVLPFQDDTPTFSPHERAEPLPLLPQDEEDTTQMVSVAAPAAAPAPSGGSSGLVNFPQAFKALFKHIRNGRWHDTQEASHALHNLMSEVREENIPEILPMLIDALEDNNALVRWVGVEALSWLRQPETVPVLGRALGDSSWQVRLSAVRGLIEIGDAVALTWIDPIFNDDDAFSEQPSSLQEAMIEALGRLGSRQRHGERLVLVLEHSRDVMVRWAAAEAVRRLRVDSAQPGLMCLLHDRNPALRWAAARSLSELATEAVVTDMITRLSDESRPEWEEKRVCDWLIEGLERIDTAEARQAIRMWQQAGV
jgi:HEAT repeat protein